MNIGKKILSAFVEVNDEKKQEEREVPPKKDPFITPPPDSVAGSASGKFRDYFNKLFTDANIPGPDYYEFSRMVEVMMSIPDERARYAAAYAGLNVQGLDKQKLLATAAQYLQILEQDASGFNQTINAALQEKVQGKQKEMEEKQARIRQLSKEISELHTRIADLQNEVKENEEKIQSSSAGYQHELETLKNRIRTDINKINQYIN